MSVPAHQERTNISPWSNWLRLPSTGPDARIHTKQVVVLDEQRALNW
jgi:hypothetical protein